MEAAWIPTNLPYPSNSYQFTLPIDFLPIYLTHQIPTNLPYPSNSYQFTLPIIQPMDILTHVQIPAGGVFATDMDLCRWHYTLDTPAPSSPDC